MFENVHKNARKKVVQDEEYEPEEYEKEFVYIFGQHFSNVLKQYKHFHTRTQFYSSHILHAYTTAY